MARNYENLTALQNAVAAHRKKKSMKAPMSEFIADYLKSSGGSLIKAVLQSRVTGQPVLVTHRGVTRSFVPVSKKRP